MSKQNVDDENADIHLKHTYRDRKKQSINQGVLFISFDKKMFFIKFGGWMQVGRLVGWLFVNTNNMTRI